MSFPWLTTFSLLEYVDKACILVVFWFPKAAVTNYCKLQWLKAPFILSQYRRPEGWSQAVPGAGSNKARDFIGKGRPGRGGSPDGAKEPCCQCRRRQRWRFDPWVGKIPWRKGMAIHFSILAWRIPWTEVPATVYRVPQSWTCISGQGAGELREPRRTALPCGSQSQGLWRWR